MNDLAGDERTVSAREEHKAGRDLDWLARTLHRHGRPKLLDRVFGHRGWDERRPDRARCDRVDADALLPNNLVRESAHERDHGALRRGVIDQLLMNPSLRCETNLLS
jgi:hypothetical protein